MRVSALYDEMLFDVHSGSKVRGRPGGKSCDFRWSAKSESQFKRAPDFATGCACAGNEAAGREPRGRADGAPKSWSENDQLSQRRELTRCDKSRSETKSTIRRSALPSRTDFVLAVTMSYRCH